MITGSVQTKGRKYYAVLRIPDREGKKRQKWIHLNLPEKSSKGLAKQKLAELLADYNRGHMVYSSEIDFAKYLEQWLEESKLHLAHSTWETYESDLRCHILPYFREHPCKLSQLAKPAIQQYCKAKPDDGKVRGKGGLAPKTIRNHHGIISKALQDAVDTKIILYNPATAVTLPKIPQRIYETYTKEQAKAFITAAYDTDLYIPVLLALCCGLRRSEIIGLQWNSINFENNSMIIRDTVVRATTIVQKRGTKSDSGYRTLSLPDTVAEALKLHKVKQDKNKAFLGSGYVDKDLVCAKTNGDLLIPGTLTSRIKRLMEKEGLPVINPHGMRHSNATLLQEWGLDIADLSSWLGHKKISTTQIYLHMGFKGKEKTANLCQANLFT